MAVYVNILQGWLLLMLVWMMMMMMVIVMYSFFGQVVCLAAMDTLLNYNTKSKTLHCATACFFVSGYNLRILSIPFQYGNLMPMSFPSRV